MNRILLVVTLIAGPALAEDAPWATYRGNAQRTGNTDNVPGPAKPEVLWFLKTNQHYVASPAVSGTDLLLPALGGFNEGVVHCFAASPKDPGDVKPKWTKGPPFIRFPVVSSPAVSEGKVIFGAGMHDTEGTTLYCIPADGGYLLWALTATGALIHIEGSPAIANGRLYVGGGAAGVLCVDPNTVTLEDKEMSVKEVPALQAAHWKKLQAKYEEEKKKDPDFAIPPTENDLLKPAPKAIWTQGQTRWHVDAPILVAGDKVLAASAFLDKEMVGDRALFCLDAATGKELWRAPLAQNPWGGPSLAGDTVIVTTSSTSYTIKGIEGAKGEVVALDLASGKEKWKKPIPGAVLGCAAVTKDAAVFTATDGKVRAFALADGSRRMIYDAKAPIFAPPAVVGNTAYVADLNGVVHAIDLKSGAAAWMLDLAKDPIKLPGANYGGVTAHGGKLYLATCNLEGPFARQPTVVVCIGTK